MSKVIIPIVTLVGFVSLLLLYLAGAGYQSGSFELGQAFAILRYCAYAGIASVGLVIFTLLWLRPQGLALMLMFISALAGLTAFYLPYRQQQIAAQVPPIHDITTDIADPPQFVAVLPLRANAPNPPEYLGGETAELQREFYPDIMTIAYLQSNTEVFAAAADIIREMGWALVDASEADGRLEATVTTQWFGFKDDVVIRLEEGPADSTVFDMRSKSRIGRSDIGANAGRIRAFIAALNQKLMVE